MTTYIACIVAGKGYATVRKVRLFCVSYQLTTAHVVADAVLENIALIRLCIEGKPGAVSAIDHPTKPLTFFYIGNITNSLEIEK